MRDSSYKDQVARAFDQSSSTYDRLGVEFFTPMGRRLVDIAAPTAGERVLDIGCGRGACLFPAAERVGVEGKVVGIDIAPGMIEEARKEVAERGLRNTELKVMDAETPDLPARSFDLVTGSYSVIFLPHATDALTRYAGILDRGGRIAFTSPVFRVGIFPFLPPEFTPLIPRALLEHLPEQWRPEALVQRFNSWLERPEDLVRTLEGCGYDSVAVVDEPVRMTAVSSEAWVDWSHTQGMRLLWQNLPPAQRAELRTRLVEGLDELSDGTGALAIDVPVRFVTARVAR
ncbi:MULTISPECIES: class I SAM-dependent methyltransferase [unclassified Streptomyces]|uniref:class I SAM-dependent methyltransferase n=1 Tax=unclassified Streptomyces TaxID=2593676 RepID=UPI00081D6842|nr:MULTISPECIES: class I SAM-dependent methyltransferase [unclassified Streptomyces]MYR96283.1 methyltransferase domain-containing protein [Streptomyces sp. SID4937]SCE06804.1 O-methyltransferase / aklanonic acid methyltransferase [Streptomyces sp. ScaeMP-e83]